MAENKKSFEESLSRLKEIVSILENGDSSLEEAMTLFTEGTALISSCNVMLDDARQKVRSVHFTESGPEETEFVSKD